ncbi:hypothetical protein TIFTF001_026823 [Ficus carica]|uniref:Uncharacterized protein n=1 Tax=Ficus carica TaxID=3494 RepID=A0AA88DLZ4_FICCA|nr:hypothetical protein TIFTF001_026823 [Ficus carica]
MMKTTTLPLDSVMDFCLALESANFWFPAQFYYKQVSYVSQTNTFRARNFCQGWGTPGEESNIEWDRIRAPSIDIPPFMPHVSGCLHDLKPSDHIEIQWKSHLDLPFSWCYGLIGHLELCDTNQNIIVFVMKVVRDLRLTEVRDLRASQGSRSLSPRGSDLRARRVIFSGDEREFSHCGFLLRRRIPLQQPPPIQAEVQIVIRGQPSRIPSTSSRPCPVSAVAIASPSDTSPS